MNIFTAIADVTKVFQQGKALNTSTIVTNTEAGAALLYGFFSAVVLLLNDLGIQVDVGATDLHTMANGWTLTISLVYGIYRIATNPAAGLK